MAEEKQGGLLSGWIKGGFTAVAGLIGGGVLMYLSPLVDKVIKPPKPLANFSVDKDGLKVSIQNRSTGGTEGWWDFGDGSALEPYVAKQESLQHAFAKPGSYAVKLSLTNLLNDANERSVNVAVEGTAPSSGPPTTDGFEVAPTRPDTYAPATFRVAAQVKNAERCLWVFGDERPVEVAADAAGNHDRLITFNNPGSYTLKLVALNGNQTIEKSKP